MVSIAVHSKARAHFPFEEDIENCISLRAIDGRSNDEDGDFEVIPYRCEGCIHLCKISTGKFLVFIGEDYLNKINQIKKDHEIDNVTVIFSDTVPKGGVIINDGSHEPTVVDGIPTHYVI